MLWMKAWLETRWRLLYALVLPLAMLVFFHAMGVAASTDGAQRMMGVVSFFFVFAAVYLAGAGIRTQSGLQAVKGLHGSMHYTLSMPVSRFRLFAVRAGFGLLETSGISIIVLGCGWLAFPPLRINSTFFDLLELILSTILCTACFYFVSVLLATFLEETWQIFGSLFALAAAWVASARLGLPASFNVFRFGAGASPLITHTLPWTAMAVSLIASAILFLTALRVVETRDY